MRWRLSFLRREPAGSSSVGIAQEIGRVAASFGQPHEFQTRAVEAAARLGPQCMDRLPDYFHHSPQKPAEASELFTGLGDWMVACQFACFEILYQFREQSLPLLRRVAFGPYDWTQANAVEILCRLAMEGIESERIGQEIAADLPNWRYEAVAYSVESLTTFARESAAVGDAFHRMVNEWAEEDPVEALVLLEPLVRNAPALARKHEALLRQISDEFGLGRRHPLLDGHVMSVERIDGELRIPPVGGPDCPSIVDLHAIRAALLLLRLNPADADLSERLDEWATHHPHAVLRQNLSRQLEELRGEVQKP